jgi:hypothetical protein
MHLICPITTSLAVIPILVVMTVNKFFICYIAVLGNWIPAQICREQTDIYPKGVRQDSLT